METGGGGEVKWGHHRPQNCSPDDYSSYRRKMRTLYAYFSFCGLPGNTQLVCFLYCVFSRPHNLEVVLLPSLLSTFHLRWNQLAQQWDARYWTKYPQYAERHDKTEHAHYQRERAKRSFATGDRVDGERLHSGAKSKWLIVYDAVLLVLFPLEALDIHELWVGVVRFPPLELGKVSCLRNRDEEENFYVGGLAKPFDWINLAQIFLQSSSPKKFFLVQFVCVGRMKLITLP